jgi:hypothetical protein
MPARPSAGSGRYSIGIGVFGSYIPSFTIPHIGELGTLWLALAFCVTGGVIALASLRHIQTPQHMQNLTTREKFSELGRAATLLYTNRNILLSSMVRIINTLSLFGFAVIMPMMFVDELGFTTSEWLQVWAASSSPPFSLTCCGGSSGKTGLDEGGALVRLHRDGALQPGVLLHPSALWP